jgi:hypothetical protein
VNLSCRLTPMFSDDGWGKPGLRSRSEHAVDRGYPPRVLDRAAAAAVMRLRIQPVAAPVTTRRTIGFGPGRKGTEAIVGLPRKPGC